MGVKIGKIIGISLLVNTLLAILKIMVGFIGSSAALLSDGIHSFSDLINDIIAFLGNRWAWKPPDNKHPFGHGKSEYLTSIIIGLLIISVALFLIKEMFSIEIIYPKLIVIIVSSIVIVLKMGLSTFLIKKGKDHQNNILIASGKESQTDVFISSIVLISAIVMQFVKKYPILKYSDKITSIIVGLSIIKVGFDIVKVNISMIIGEQVTDRQYLYNIKKIIFHEQSIIKIEELLILKCGPYLKLIGIVGMKSNLSLLKVHNKINNLEKKLKNYDHKINYILIKTIPITEVNSLN